MKRQKTVCILYGFGEGPRVGKRLIAALQTAGYTITDDAATADILIAHSGGIWLLPENTANKVVIMMNPSCTPLHKLPAVFIQKMFIEFVQSVKKRHIKSWLQKSVANTWYVLTRPAYNLRMVARGTKDPTHLPAIAAQQVIIVNARHDPWASHLPRSETARLPHYVFISHPGSHDGLWLHPKYCVDIVQSVYGKRLLATARAGEAAVSRARMEPSRKS
jgi:hypothetical protein